jgi:hypothetical protein
LHFCTIGIGCTSVDRGHASSWQCIKDKRRAALRSQMDRPKSFGGKSLGDDCREEPGARAGESDFTVKNGDHAGVKMDQRMMCFYWYTDCHTIQSAR